jgi:hypothetical protein
MKIHLHALVALIAGKSIPERRLEAPLLLLVSGSFTKMLILGTLLAADSVSDVSAISGAPIGDGRDLDSASLGAEATPRTGQFIQHLRRSWSLACCVVW